MNPSFSPLFGWFSGESGLKHSRVKQGRSFWGDLEEIRMIYQVLYSLKRKGNTTGRCEVITTSSSLFTCDLWRSWRTEAVWSLIMMKKSFNLNMLSCKWNNGKCRDRIAYRREKERNRRHNLYCKFQVICQIGCCVEDNGVYWLALPSTGILIAVCSHVSPPITQYFYPLCWPIPISSCEF